MTLVVSRRFVVGRRLVGCVVGRVCFWFVYG